MAKHSHKYGLPSDERDPRHRSSKDTKRWCRGRIGIEHRQVWSDEADTLRTRWGLPYYEILTCAECGKQFDKKRKAWTIPMIIRAVRMAQGLTQEELGQKVGMPQNRITVIENGEDNLTIKTVKRFAEALNITVDMHFYDCGDVRLNESRSK